MNITTPRTQSISVMKELSSGISVLSKVGTVLLPDAFHSAQYIADEAKVPRSDVASCISRMVKSKGCVFDKQVINGNHCYRLVEIGEKLQVMNDAGVIAQQNMQASRHDPQPNVWYKPTGNNLTLNGVFK